MEDVDQDISEPKFVDESGLKLITPEQEEELLLSKTLIKPPEQSYKKPTFSKIKIKPVSSIVKTLEEDVEPGQHEDIGEERPEIQSEIEAIPEEVEKSKSPPKPPFKSIMIKPRSTITESLIEPPKKSVKKPPLKKIKIKTAISPKSPLSLDNLVTETPTDVTE